MIRPRSLNLTPTSSFSTTTTNSGKPTIVSSSSIQVGPVSPPATPLLPSSPDSMVSPSIFPSPTTSSRSMSIRENVQVIVRLRPHSNKEQQQLEQPCWITGPEPGMIQQLQTRKGQSSVFQYDSVVSGVDNELVYHTGIGDLVRSTMAGYNGTVFAYGQTASGKTYTMNPGREFMLRVSYLEIYKEKIRDLIGDNDQLIPEIREDKKRGVYVKNLHEEIVTSAQQVLDVIKKGEDNRHISATDYNTYSSRSHTILQIVIESRSKDVYTPEQGSVRVSQLNLIDLAGSEKATSDVERRKEGGYINKSLLSLGNVISQLIQKMHNEKVHVQYRSSTLTRVLQTALSGNARISIVCTINPTWRSKDESLNTLRFAQRAKLIRTSAKMTKINEHSELQKCLSTIAELQTKMQEKTEQEFETKERLSHLLGLILTSSKNAPPTVAAVSKLADRVITGDSILSHSTMQEVFAQCEQGLTATREEMFELQQSLEKAHKTTHEQNAYIKKQRQQLEHYSQSIEALEKELSSCHRDRDEYSQQVQEYREHIKELTSRMASLENELVSSQEKQDDLVHVIATREDQDHEQVSELKLLTESLQEQVNLLHEQLEERLEEQELSSLASSTSSVTLSIPSVKQYDNEKQQEEYHHYQQQQQMEAEKEKVEQNSRHVEELEKILATCRESLNEKEIASLAVEKKLKTCMETLNKKTTELLITKKQLEEERHKKQTEMVTMTITSSQQQQQQHDNNKSQQQKLNIPVIYGGAWTILAATAMYAFSISC
ncbi:hypothetical protein INT45_012713 [Circinella minor]|uniref:Kinesin-like protein n=1 Tax=Circinella minor TaxID=1195481 RepID=A0A8H7S6S5_9FUNG|nr:hypothetical protein INT45_012713 [Circinella minor]